MTGYSIPRSIFGVSSTEVIFTTLEETNGDYIDIRNMDLNGSLTPNKWITRINPVDSNEEGYNNGLFVDVANKKAYNLIYSRNKYLFLTLDTDTGNVIGQKYIYSK